MSIANSWKLFWKKRQPAIQKMKENSNRRSKKILGAWKKVDKYKKLILGAPIAAASLILCIINLFELPALVGLGLQSDGEYTIELIREVAVLGPLILTSLCLLMLFASKRTLTPWMVSLFSLLLPLMILLTNTFPA